MTTSPWPIRDGSLVFREADENDIEQLLSFRNDVVVNRFMVRTQVNPETLRREWLAVPTSASDFSCVADENGQVVAMGFLDIVDGLGQPGMPAGTEAVIGYIVDPAASGRGVGTALARALLTAAFDRLGLRRVTAAAAADNHGSVAVLERAGLRREQHAIEALWHTELGWIDEYQYAILDREWGRLHDA